MKRKTSFKGSSLVEIHLCSVNMQLKNYVTYFDRLALVRWERVSW